MYLAESDKNRKATGALTVRLPRSAVIEAVRPVPMPKRRNRRIGSHADASLEPGKRSRAVRERAQSSPGRVMEEAMAGRQGARSCVDGGVAVQLSLAARLQIEDP